MSVLRQESESDYLLEENATSCWITIDNISVYVRRTDEGVAVDLYPLGQEMEDSLCGTWALFSEAEEQIEDERKYRDEQRAATQHRKDARDKLNGYEEAVKGGD